MYLFSCLSTLKLVPIYPLENFSDCYFICFHFQINFRYCFSNSFSSSALRFIFTFHLFLSYIRMHTSVSYAELHKAKGLQTQENLFNIHIKERYSMFRHGFGSCFRVISMSVITNKIKDLAETALLARVMSCLSPPLLFSLEGKMS